MSASPDASPYPSYATKRPLKGELGRIEKDARPASVNFRALDTTLNLSDVSDVSGSLRLQSAVFWVAPQFADD